MCRYLTGGLSLASVRGAASNSISSGYLTSRPPQRHGIRAVLFLPSRAPPARDRAPPQRRAGTDKSDSVIPREQRQSARACPPPTGPRARSRTSAVGLTSRRILTLHTDIPPPAALVSVREGGARAFTMTGLVGRDTETSNIGAGRGEIHQDAAKEHGLVVRRSPDCRRRSPSSCCETSRPPARAKAAVKTQPSEMAHRQEDSRCQQSSFRVGERVIRPRSTAAHVHLDWNK